MGIGSLTRFWRSRGTCAVLAIAVPLMAMADTTTPPAKSTHPTQPSGTHSTSSHSTSAHTSSSHTKSATAKTGSTTSTTQHSKHATAHSSRGKKTAKSAKKHGQQVIDSGRARQIQEALIREHYLTGEPSGTWDSATQAAMQRYQSDQGWQNKTTPDSRALIKLGLGPSNDHLLNPESAMTSSAMNSAAPGANGADPAAKAAPKPPADSNLKPATDSNSTPTPNQQPNR